MNFYSAKKLETIASWLDKVSFFPVTAFKQTFVCLQLAILEQFVHAISLPFQNIDLHVGLWFYIQAVTLQYTRRKSISLRRVNTLLYAKDWIEPAIPKYGTQHLTTRPPKLVHIIRSSMPKRLEEVQEKIIVYM